MVLPSSRASHSMLSGRESLVRLIGKRRRIISPHTAELLRDAPRRTADKDAATAAGPSSSVSDAPPPSLPSSTGKVAGLTYGSPWVNCPVCGGSVRGTDDAVNSHLDMCLSKGTKRKLTQCTLFDSYFNPRSGRKLLADSNTLEGNPRKWPSDDETDNIHIPHKYGSVESFVEKQCSSVLSKHSSDNLKLCTEDPLEDIVSEDAVRCRKADPLSSFTFCQSMKVHEVDRNEAKDVGSVMSLETFIVGRKFHENVELQEGAIISISREPENVKDKHAIKVLSVDTGQPIGYLPRELAKYLSVLIDKHQIKFQGSVASIPTHPLDAVPIQLLCQTTMTLTEMDLKNQESLGFLWESCLQVVDYEKIHPPSMTRYQQNFCLLIQDALNNHAHLFTDDEKNFLASFNSLSDDGQRLFIRLYTRKGPWFRTSNISYTEILNPQKATEELQLAGYVCSFTSSEDLLRYDLKELIDVLTVFEMREVLSLELSKKGISSARRKELVNFLLSGYADGTCPQLPRIVLERTGTCVKISSAAELLLWRVQRLFFLNGEQDLSAFLLVDLGLIKFPNYNCNVSRPLFHARDDLLAYEEAIEVAQVMDQSLDENNVEMVSRCIAISDDRLLTYIEEETQSSAVCGSPTFLSYFTASWVYSKVIFLGVSVVERERRYEDAVRLLKGLLSSITCDSRRGYWTLRLSIDLEHMGRVNESLIVAEEGVLDPWVRSGSKMALQRRVLRLGKPPRRWKRPIFAESVMRKIKEVNVMGRPLTSETGTKNLFYGYDGELCGVEQLALQYYAGEGGGWQGVHSESGIWMTIYGLLMWDVIFSDVADVFRSRFQTAPLDLTTDNFYIARKTLIESHLQKIYEGYAEEILITSWESHMGTACRGVNWDMHSLSDLRAAVSCIGGHCLASLCRHLALDYGSWSSGMPDLLLWRFYGGGRDGGEAKLVEVKGPRDRLSEQQRAWMLLLMDYGFNIEVCKVNPPPKSK